MFGNLNVAVGIDRDGIADQRRARIMANRDEHAGDGERGLRSADRIAHAQARHGGIALHGEHRGVGQERDLVVGPGALQHDSGRTELVAAVHKGDTARESGQEGGLLHGGITTTDHGDVLIFEEESVTGGTGTHAAAKKFLLPRDPEVARSRTHGQDHRPSAVGLPACSDHLLDRSGQGHRFDVFHL